MVVLSKVAEPRRFWVRVGALLRSAWTRLTVSRGRSVGSGGSGGSVDGQVDETCVTGVWLEHRSHEGCTVRT